MYNVKKVLLAVLFYFLLFQISNDAQVNGNDIMHALQKKFNSLENISAGFIESINGKQNLSGTVYFQKENKIRLEFKNILLVSDGKSTWNYNRKENKLIISTYDDTDPSLISIKYIVDVLPSKCEIKSDNTKDGIILTPKENGMNFKRVIIILNQDNLIKNLTIENNNGDEIKIVFSNYKLNIKLPESLFSINPPKGSKVIDLR